MKGKQEEGICSLCGSENVDYGSSQREESSLGHEITCNDCGGWGMEWYNVVYSETNMNSEESKRKEFK